MKKTKRRKLPPQPEVNTSQPGRFISKADALAHAERFVAERYAEEKKKSPSAYYEKLGVLTAFALDLIEPGQTYPTNIASVLSVETANRLENILSRCGGRR